MRARGSAAAANVPSGVDGDDVGVTEPGVEGRSVEHGVTAPGEAVAPRRRGMTLDDDGSAAGRRSRCRIPSPVRAAATVRHRPRPPARPTRRTGGRSAGGGSGAGRRRPSSRTRPPDRRRAWPSPGTACAAGDVPARTRRRDPACRREPEAAVVQVDARRRLDQPAAEARGVGLDQADRHAGVVGRAEVRGVAGASSIGRRRLARSGVDQPGPPGDGLHQRVTVGRLVEHARGGRTRPPWPSRSGGGPSADRRRRRAARSRRPAGRRRAAR